MEDLRGLPKPQQLNSADQKVEQDNPPFMIMVKIPKPDKQFSFAKKHVDSIFLFFYIVLYNHKGVWT